MSCNHGTENALRTVLRVPVCVLAIAHYGRSGVGAFVHPGDDKARHHPSLHTGLNKTLSYAVVGVRQCADRRGRALHLIGDLRSAREPSLMGSGAEFGGPSRVQ